MVCILQHHFMQQGNLKGEKDFNGQTVKLDVPIVLFEEDNIHYAYIPSFDLLGYGTTPEEARESMTIVLDEFLRYSLNKNTFFIELKRLGWIIKSKRKPMKAPQMSEMINTNEQLRDIINHKKYSTSNHSVNMPAFA